MISQKNSQNLDDFKKPWNSLNAEEKKQVLSECSEKEYIMKQRVVSAYMNYFKNELSSFTKEENLPEKLYLKPEKTTSFKILKSLTFNQRIPAYQSIAAACFILISLILFNIYNSHKLISDNIKTNKINNIYNKLPKQTLNIVFIKKCFISLQIPRITEKLQNKNTTEEEVVQQILNTFLTDTPNDEITEYLLSYGKDDIKDYPEEFNLLEYDSLNTMPELFEKL